MGIPRRPDRFGAPVCGTDAGFSGTLWTEPHRGPIRLGGFSIQFPVSPGVSPGDHWTNRDFKHTMQMHRRFSETPERLAALHSVFRTVQTANAHHANGGTVTTNESSEDNSTTLPRRQLGQYLKENRLAAGLKLEDVAPLMQWSASKLSLIEAGKSPNVRVVDVEALCRIYDIEDEEVIAGLVGLARQSAGKSWWQAYDDIISGNRT